MTISIISFTGQGRQLAEKIRDCFQDWKGENCREIHLYQKPEQGLSSWVKDQFENRNAILFIGACGIAVRAIAPYVQDKLSDPPILVMDEKGRYVIPILSGHIGGANELARLLSEKTGAEAVITTATDLNGKFAIDLFAQKNSLRIMNREQLAKISAKVLKEETLLVSVEDEKSRVKNAGGLCMFKPEWVDYPPQQKIDVLISSKVEEPEMAGMAVLWLKPKEYILGIGCRKGKTKEEIDAFIQKNMEKARVSVYDIAAIASIKQKQNERGICRWAEENRIPFVTFSEEELRQVKGSFHGSVFVKQTVGVDNVCERAALCACRGEGTLILDKQTENGMTLAVAKRRWQIEWEGQ